MESVNHTFRNNGFGEYNDDILNKIFELKDAEYFLTIKPNINTNFWRLGIRLSKTKDIHFYHPTSRYNNLENTEYVDIHLAAGDFNGEIWEKPHKLELVQYNLPNIVPHPLNISYSYTSHSTVDWSIKYLQQEEAIYLSYKAQGVKLFAKPFLFNKDYKYFMVFAWADNISFEIDCTINISTEDTSSKNRGPKEYIEPELEFPITDKFRPVIGVKEIAEETGKIIKELKDEKGNMFGIFGQWGRGKTLLWREISDYLSNSEDKNELTFEKITFHAWKYQDTPASWAYLYETIADKYFKKETLHFEKENQNNNFIKRVYNYFSKEIKIFRLSIKNYTIYWKKRVRLNIKRKGFNLISYFFLSLFLSLIWYFIIPFEVKVGWVIYFLRTLTIIAIIKIVYLYFIFKPKAINIFNQYSEKVSFHNFLGLQAEIQKEMICLLQTWIGKNSISKRKILLFVDDIDRCNEDKIIQVVDSLKVMLEDEEIAKRIIVLVAIDERVLKMAIRLKYKDLISNDTRYNRTDFLEDLTKEYIDKLFLAGIKLGHLSFDEKLEIFGSVTEGNIEPYQIENVISDKPIEAKAAEHVNNDIDDQETNLTIIKNSNAITKKYLINQSEKEILEEFLPFIENSTPRSIRIYFYRYLLAKNIKKHKFIKGSLLYQLWHNSTNKSILPALIVFYSNQRGFNQIQNDYKEAIRRTDNTIPLEYFNQAYLLDTNLYLELLRIVEMVVPY